MDKDKVFIWLTIILTVSFSIGLIIGANIQSNANRQIAERAQARETSAELEAMVQGYEDVLINLERFYERTTVLASWYGHREHGRLRADGKRFDMTKNTLAHRSLPFGTVLLMENLDNGKMSLGVCRDRGPYISPRALDVSYAIAQELGMIERGLAVVRIIVLWKPQYAKDILSIKSGN